MEEKNSFLEAKNGLLQVYSSAQTDQVARIIGFSIALFTLVEAIRGSQQPLLSSIFSTISSAIPDFFVDMHWLPELFKLVLLSLSMWVLLYGIVRAVIRFSLFAYYVNAIQNVMQEEIDIRPLTQEEKEQEEKKSVEWKEIKLSKNPRKEFLERYKRRMLPEFSLHTRILCIAENVIACGTYERNTKLFLFPLRIFLSPEYKSFGTTERRGKLVYYGLPVLITGLLILFLW